MAAVEHSVTQIEQELVKALIAGDASIFERYLADTYIFTAPDGMVSDKAQTITDIKSGHLKFQSSKLEDMKVQAYGDTAVATYGSTDQGSYKAKTLVATFDGRTYSSNEMGAGKSSLDTGRQSPAVNLLLKASDSSSSENAEEDQEWSSVTSASQSL